jgi:hypothetical protein
MLLAAFFPPTSDITKKFFAFNNFLFGNALRLQCQAWRCFFVQGELTATAE